MHIHDMRRTGTQRCTRQLTLATRTSWRRCSAQGPPSTRAYIVHTRTRTHAHTHTHTHTHKKREIERENERLLLDMADMGELATVKGLLRARANVNCTDKVSVSG
eukprot:Tamp_33669.p2 GENE.Tamp_33669~~Tamp_33669.p2  ORF type:complete len:105 (-),score=11.53 Tamp_33669:83-397(-)